MVADSQGMNFPLCQIFPVFLMGMDAPYTDIMAEPGEAMVRCRETGLARKRRLTRQHYNRAVKRLMQISPPELIGMEGARSVRNGIRRLMQARAGGDGFFFVFFFLGPAEEAFGGSTHRCHGHKGLAIIVAGIPEKKSDAAVGFGGDHLLENVIGRIGFGAPGKSLQPGPQGCSASRRDLAKAFHGFTDEMLGSVAGMVVSIHAEKVGG